MSFNGRLVNNYKEDELKALLSNPSRYRRIILDKFSRKDKDCKLNDLALIDALDNYIVKTLNSTPWVLNKQELTAYRDFLYSVHSTNRSIVFDSILFRKGNIEKVFSDDQVKNLSVTKRQATINANHELKKLMSQPGQTASDLLIRFAETQIENDSDTVKNFVDNLFSYIMNNQDCNKGYYAREFMARYAAYSAVKDLKIPPVAVYLTNYDMRGDKISPGERGCSYGNSSVINVSRDYALDKVTKDTGLPNYMSIIHTVCHEVKHSSQAFHTSNGEFTLETFNYIKMQLFSNYLSNDKYDEYKTNYIHTEIESDSNYYGWRQTERILKKFCSNMIDELTTVVSNSIVTTFQEETATKLGNVRKQRMAKERFNVESLDSIMKAHPEILVKYPQLKQIYAPNGKRYSFMERLRLKGQSSIKNIDEIYRDFDVYDFQTGEVEKIDIDRLKTDEKFLFFTKIFDMTMNEIKSFNNSIKVFNYYPDRSSFREKEFYFIGLSRIKRIVNLIELINANEKTIMKLDEINRRNGSPYIFMTSLDFVRSFLKSGKRYAGDFKNKYGNDAEKAAMMAELSSLEQVEVFENGTRK